MPGAKANPLEIIKRLGRAGVSLIPGAEPDEVGRGSSFGTEAEPSLEPSDIPLSILVSMAVGKKPKIPK